MRLDMLIITVTPSLFGCAVNPSSEVAPAPSATDALSRQDLAAADSTDIIGWLRRVKPTWFAAGPGTSQPRVVVDREPREDDVRLALSVPAINQIAYFPAEAAAGFFGTTDGRPIISIATTAGDSRSPTALRPTAPEGPPVDKRIGMLVGWQHLDNSSAAVVIEAVATVAWPNALSVSVGVHQSRHDFTRSFSNGAVTDSPLRIRYAFFEPRYNLRLGPDAHVTPFAGFRLFAGQYRLLVNHPLDPAPDVLKDSDMGGGFSGGVTWMVNRLLAVESSVSYSLFQMDIAGFGNIGYILDEPIRVKDAYLLTLRLGGMLSF